MSDAMLLALVCLAVLTGSGGLGKCGTWTSRYGAISDETLTTRGAGLGSLTGGR